MNAEGLSYYSVQELALRNGRQMKEVWIAYKGKIYDVSCSELFEKGRHYEHDAGVDLTAEMIDAPHWDDVLNDFPIVGILND
ncbi:MAG: cytochrome b5 domain-containing protein [Flavobacteriales bacterium]